MAHHFEFDHEHRILLVVLEDDVSSQEITTINNDILLHVERMNPVAGISDFTKVKSFNVSGQTLRTAALQPSPYPEKTPRFIVAPVDYLFGMGRMYELIANRPLAKLQVVRSREEALAAVGVKGVKFERIE
jgi:hypothetical protein